MQILLNTADWYQADPILLLCYLHFDTTNPFEESSWLHVLADMDPSLKQPFQSQLDFKLIAHGGHSNFGHSTVL